jgi:hypothetical protein
VRRQFLPDETTQAARLGLPGSLLEPAAARVISCVISEDGEPIRYGSPVQVVDRGTIAGAVLFRMTR